MSDQIIYSFDEYRKEALSLLALSKQREDDDGWQEVVPEGSSYVVRSSSASERSPAQEHRWREMFRQMFVVGMPEMLHREHADDMLFFVRKNSLKDKLFVRRKGKTLPEDVSPGGAVADSVDWVKSTLLNTVLQTPYHLTVSSCRYEQLSNVLSYNFGDAPGISQVTKKVFASPTKVHMNLDSSRTECAQPQVTYPNICFAVDNFEDAFRSLVLNGPDECYAVCLWAHRLTDAERDSEDAPSIKSQDAAAATHNAKPPHSPSPPSNTPSDPLAAACNDTPQPVNPASEQFEPSPIELAIKDMRLSDRDGVSQGQSDGDSVSQGQSDGDGVSQGQSDRDGVSQGQRDRDGVFQGQRDRDGVSQGQRDREARRDTGESGGRHWGQQEELTTIITAQDDTGVRTQEGTGVRVQEGTGVNVRQMSTAPESVNRTSADAEHPLMPRETTQEGSHGPLRRPWHVVPNEKVAIELAVKEEPHLEADDDDDTPAVDRHEGDSDPLPILLFSGYVSFQQLESVVHSNSSSLNPLHFLMKNTQNTQRIVMRGPGGVGHADVAVTVCSPSPPSSISQHEVTPGADDRRRGSFLSSAFQFAKGAANVAKDLAVPASITDTCPPPPPVRCALMTLQLPLQHIARQALQGS